MRTSKKVVIKATEYDIGELKDEIEKAAGVALTLINRIAWIAGMMQEIERSQRPNKRKPPARKVK